MNPITGLLVSLAMAVVAALLGMSALLGAAVAARPHLLERLRIRSDRRYSMRRATRAFDRPRDVDRWFYRHHRVYGATVAVLAIFLLHFVAFGELRTGWSNMFGPEYREIAQMVGEVARIVLWLVAVFALVVGTIVFVRPSALKAVEQWANRWMTTRRYTRGLERQYHGIDALLSRRPRLWGIVVTVASIACLVALIVQWRMSSLGS